MLKDSRGVDTWQLHVSDEAGEYNASTERIANIDDSTARWLKVTATNDGAFTVHDPRTGELAEYCARNARCARRVSTVEERFASAKLSPRNSEALSLFLDRCGTC